MKFETMDVTERVDPLVRELLTAFQDIGYVAGSAARWIVMGHEALSKSETPGDIDIFLYDTDALDKALAVMVNLGYKEKVRKLAVTFERRSIVGDSIPVQIVIPFKSQWQNTSGLPESVLAQFAFTCQQFAVEWHNGRARATYTPRAVDDVLDHRVRINNISEPLLVVWAINKYAAKGYTMPPGEIADVFVEWDKRPAPYKMTAIQDAHETGRYPSGERN